MGATLVVAAGPKLYLLPADAPRPLAFDVPSGPDGPLRPAAGDPDAIPSELDRAIAALGADVELRAGGAPLARALSRGLGRPVAAATVAEWRRARASVPVAPPDAARRYLRAVARAALDRALRAPEEMLISLAREEERLDRAVGREHRASEAFLTVPASPLAAYSARWSVERERWDRHLDALREEVERAARSVAPNLSDLVGPRIAARLIAAAGSVAAVGRMRAARLQLLGTRRRPSPERGPRFGILYGADRLGELSPARRAAFARSLAALAVIAARADAYTHRSIAADLIRRRDRRIAELQRRRP
ncbi:MAG TPA: hypothetical protein VMG36_05975 [Thermoplasmata archaeon]|nr:hypothetical protein [Thermoplasmata archaeon]